MRKDGGDSHADRETTVLSGRQMKGKGNDGMRDTMEDHVRGERSYLAQGTQYLPNLEASKTI